MFISGKQPGNDEAVLISSDTAFAKEEIEDTRHRLQKLREGVGDRGCFYVASGNQYLKEKLAGCCPA
jgi:hypothetical protein